MYIVALYITVFPYLQLIFYTILLILYMKMLKKALDAQTNAHMQFID
jgi:hypothetical protein